MSSRSALQQASRKSARSDGSQQRSAMPLSEPVPWRPFPCDSEQVRRRDDSQYSQQHLVSLIGSPHLYQISLDPGAGMRGSFEGDWHHLGDTQRLFRPSVRVGGGRLVSSSERSSILGAVRSSAEQLGAARTLSETPFFAHLGRPADCSQLEMLGSR